MKKTDFSKKPGQGIDVFEMCVFAMLGAIMLMSKLLMEALPNIHLLGVLTMTYTLAFRKRALIPIYLYVMLNGLISGFSLWWLPYLYIWTILWGATIILPQNMPRKLKFFVYPIVCCLHGLIYGILYSPAQALIFGLDFNSTLAWIAAGFTFDVIHAIGNFVLGFLILPLSELLVRLSHKHYAHRSIKSDGGE
jgi:energy-coupling factor transport system substrate-specific component